MKTNAKEAKERSISSATELTRQLIETRIEAKITAGKRYCEIVFHVPESILDELNKAKYKVTLKRGSSRKNDYYIVSW